MEENEPLARRLYRNGVKWYRKYYKPNQPNNFTQDTGPQVETESPVAAFSALFTDDLIDMLVYQTNLYATQNVNGPIKTQPTAMQCVFFLGLNVMMGIQKLPLYRDYWSSKQEIRDPFISK